MASKMRERKTSAQDCTRNPYSSKRFERGNLEEQHNVGGGEEDDKGTKVNLLRGSSVFRWENLRRGGERFSKYKFKRGERPNSRNTRKCKPFISNIYSLCERGRKRGTKRWHREPEETPLFLGGR